MHDIVLAKILENQVLFLALDKAIMITLTIVNDDDIFITIALL